MIKVSAYTPQRANTQMKKSNQASFGNGSELKHIQALSRIVGPATPARLDSIVALSKVVGSSEHLGATFAAVREVTPKAVEPEKEIDLPFDPVKAVNDFFKSVEESKVGRGPYMGGVPSGVKNPEAYRTGPFYLD